MHDEPQRSHKVVVTRETTCYAASTDHTSKHTMNRLQCHDRRVFSIKDLEREGSKNLSKMVGWVVGVAVLTTGTTTTKERCASSRMHLGVWS